MDARTQRQVRKLLSCVLSIILLMACFPAAVAESADAANGFAIWFNPDGKTAVTAGQQGSLPVWALEDMKAKENTVTAGDVVSYTVQGSNNPKAAGENAKGVIPDTGAAMYVVAPADGVVTAYGINGSGKTFWQVKVNAAGEITEVTSITDEGEVAVPVEVKTGETVWFYCNGSKFQFAGIDFVPAAAPAAPAPAAAEAFAVVLNADGKTAIAAGQQGNYPVYALEDMKAKENSVTVNGAAAYTVQGSNNPKAAGENAKGVIPDTGAAMYVVAPADGVVTAYGINGSGKTFWQVKVNAAGEITEVTSITDEGEVAVPVEVKAGETVWFYCNGSKFQFAAIGFEPAAAVPAADTSFTYVFNADGTAAATAGQLAEAPIFLLEDMKAKENTVTLNGETIHTVQGSNNPKLEGSNAKGVVPDTGAAISVTAPSDGIITVYGINGTNSDDGSGKTFWVVPVGGEAVSSNDPGEIAVSYEAKAGETVWFYAAGSKFQFAAVTFASANAAPAVDTTPKPDDRAWQFIRFGTSTSDEANRIGEGADINGSVTLYSCTVDENGAVAKKGGKFVSDAPADGVSFYYTTIDPTKENFILTADVHIDYMNPTPDGQEGFALQLRDTISGSGSYFSNTMSVGSSKLYVAGVNTYSVLGTRNYVGINSNEDADKNNVVATLQAFTIDSSDQVRANQTYRVQLEKTSYGYITSQYRIQADGSTGELLGQHIYYIPAKDLTATSVSSYEELDDPMCVQESNVAYLALVTARGMNATFSNITFMTSPWVAADWHVQPTTYVDTNYEIKSASTASGDMYELIFQANADGVLTIKDGSTVLDENIAITANVQFSKDYPIEKTTNYTLEFTPNADYKPSAFEELRSYDTAKLSKYVIKRSIGAEDGTIYVKPNGKATNMGTSWDDAVDVQTAVNYVAPGQTILLAADRYQLRDTQLLIERGRDGTAEAPIVMTTDGGFATFDFCGTGSGVMCWGDYWKMSYINVCNTIDRQKGMQLGGNNCVLERMNFYNNGTTGLQISGTSLEPYELWPANNTVINCTAINNGDSGYEDADGFAAKLTCGPGNEFIGCIAAYNADDGWDLFAKAGSGEIGAVVIRDSVCYRNGYLMVKPDSQKLAIIFADIVVDENGSLSFVGELGKDYIMVEAGNGNGFKLGGTNIPGDHKLYNSISYENKAKGIDSNSCPDIKVYDCTTFNNGSYNVAFYTNNKSATTGFAAEGVLSFRTEGNTAEQLKLQSQATTDVYGEYNFFWNTETQTSANTVSAPVTVSADWFQSLDTSVAPSRNADGTIDMHGLLLLTEAARAYETGAQGAAWGQAEQAKATFWVVGDSTVCGFTDSYYIPREGYGEQLERYFSATVYNLAHSGASSKDFLGMAEYQTLLNGSDTVPALGNAEGDQFLIIGFGHNDEKTEAARYTNPNGDYLTEGSFANSLYVNYVKPAVDAGVTPVLVTPIARLTTANTAESYASASGHITADTTVGDVTYAGGDYAQTIRDMAAALDLICIDMTAATIERNVAMGEGAQWLHTWNGAKYADDGVTMIPTALDKTHTNTYGAKMNAWQIAQLAEGTALAQYVKAGKEQPSYEKDFADSINPDYVIVPYDAPTTTSANWPAYTDAQGNVWYGTVFGDVGGNDKITNGSFFASEVEGGMNIGVANNAGKISSTTDGLIFYYTTLPAGTSFTFTATATINDMAANNQVSFGLMARDDLYIDTYNKSTMGDYVAAGTRNQGAFNCFGRKSGVLYNGPAAEKVYAVGDTLDLKIVGTSDGFTLTYGENEPVSAGFDYALTTVDDANIYVGFYAVRNANITFTNIKLELN
ncbi:MAG: right-handed parallel beta-helix repeat-containing protein [Clostridia bacterium]|nr:right-handed parallel beta-helix repeat-containing protein [Clostridia bacterium]